MSKKKIIVAIPERHHSYELISSLRRMNYDVYYYTMVYFKNRSLMLKILSKILPQKEAIRAKGRHCDGIEDERVKRILFFNGLIELLLMRISKKAYFKFRKKNWLKFQKKITKIVKKEKPDILIMYEDWYSNTFKSIGNCNVIKVLDCAAASKEYMKIIYENDEKNCNCKYLKSECPEIYNTNLVEKSDLLMADYFLVPSNFSKKSYQYVGIEKNNIFTINYPLSLSEEKNKIKFKNVPLKFVYSGQISYRKGLHHLLEAFQKLSETENIELYLYGEYDAANVIYRKYNNASNIHFEGWVLKEKLIKELKKANIFVFPSLADSLSFSCAEAMGVGLPIICTDNTGISDFIENYKNGIVIKAGSTEELYEAMKWCLHNKDKLGKMGQEAKNTILSVSSKTDYDIKLKKFIESIIEKQDCSIG